MNQIHRLLKRAHILYPVVGISLLSVASLAGAKTDVEERILELDSVANLKAKAVEADISVNSHEANTARLVISRTVKDLSEEEAATVLEHIKTKFEIDEDTVILESKLPKNKKEWKKLTGHKNVKFDLEYKLWIPSRLNLAIHAVDGDLSVEKIAGKCKLVTVDGDIFVKEAGSRIDANTVDGDVLIQSAQGSVNTHTVDGDVMVKGNSSIKAKSVDGDIVAEFTGQPEEDSYINTMDGDVQVILPSDVSISITATSLDGEVQCELPIETSTAKRSKLIGDINGGGPNLKLNTIDGDIEITKANN